MPNSNPSKRAAEISETLEILRTQSLSHPDEAGISANASDELQVTLKWLTTLASGYDIEERKRGERK